MVLNASKYGLCPRQRYHVVDSDSLLTSECGGVPGGGGGDGVGGLGLGRTSIIIMINRTKAVRVTWGSLRTGLKTK